MTTAQKLHKKKSVRGRQGICTTRLLLLAWKEAADKYTAIGSGASEAACRAARANYYLALCGAVPPLRRYDAAPMQSEYVPWLRGQPCPYVQVRWPDDF